MCIPVCVTGKLTASHVFELRLSITLILVLHAEDFLLKEIQILLLLILILG